MPLNRLIQPFWANELLTINDKQLIAIILNKVETFIVKNYGTKIQLRSLELQKFYDFINNNILYPEKAIKNNIEGMVTVEFTIDTSGNYKDFIVIRDIGYGCSEEVLKVIKKSKKWNSALNGTLVNQRVSLEVPFKLLD